MFNNQPTFRAGGTIPPSVFVIMDVSNDNQVVVATANSRTVGISRPGMKGAPGVSGSDVTIAAVANDQIQIYTLGDVCLLIAGSGGWTRGDLLEAATGGVGVTSSTDGHHVGAYALESAVQYQAAKVQVVFMMRGA